MSNEEVDPRNSPVQQYKINWEQIETVEQLKCIVDIMLFAKTGHREGRYPEIYVPEAVIDNLTALKPITTKIDMNWESSE